MAASCQILSERTLRESAARKVVRLNAAISQRKLGRPPDMASPFSKPAETRGRKAGERETVPLGG